MFELNFNITTDKNNSNGKKVNDKKLGIYNNILIKYLNIIF